MRQPMLRRRSVAANKTRYNMQRITSAIVLGGVDTGCHAAYSSFAQTPVAFPFPVGFYGQLFNAGSVGPNCSLQFTSTSNSSDPKLPNPLFNGAIIGFFRNEYTDDIPGGLGVFAQTTGVAPNRAFHLQWKSKEGFGGSCIVEMRFFEGTSDFEIHYGSGDSTQGAYIGIQKGTGQKIMIFGSSAAQVTPLLTPGDALQFKWLPGANVRPTPVVNTKIRWKLDEALPPYANSGTDGALNLLQGSSPQVTVAGPWGSTAPSFDGHVSGGTTALLTAATSKGEPTNKQAVSIYCFAQLRSHTAYAELLTKCWHADGSWAAPYLSFGLIEGTAGGADATMQIGAAVAGALVIFTCSKDMVIPLGEKFMIGATYDGAHFIPYINGVAGTPVAQTGDLDYGQHGPWMVGADSDTSVANQPQRIDGWVSEACMVDGVLTANQMLAIANAGLG